MNQRGRTALLLLGRDPTGPRTGRIAVLESAVKGLQRAGVRVEVVAITSAPGPDEWLGAGVVRLAPQRTIQVAASAAKALVSGGTLNCAVFDSARLRKQVRGQAEAWGAEVVVADGLRTFDLAEATGLPVITHLDDLLSNRYGSRDFVEGNTSILGYYSQELPAPLRRAAEALAARLMGLEARRAHTSEVAIARRSAVSAMTSHEEAAELASRSGVDVQFLPMAVDVAEDAGASAAPAESAVFVGALHYGPNIAALHFLHDEVLPELRKRGRNVNLQIIGKIGKNDLSGFDDPSFHFTDYAPDLAAALEGHRMLLSPITAGTGVKTKALDGMSVALPVVATTMGVAGIPVTPGVDVLIGDTVQEFAAQMERLMDDPALADAVGHAGQEILRTKMTSEAVYRTWARALERAVGNE